MAEKGRTGIKRIVLAGWYSMQGLKTAWRKEAAFRQELFLAVILVPAGIWLGESNVERALLAGSCMVVLITELLNSAVEAVVDRIGSEHHALAGAAKDLGSAAVFMSLLMTCVIWGLIFYDHFL